jgi:nucleotide-sensitive chloride channel 1A
VGYESVLPGVTDGLGGLPPPFPGSGGWITAENVGDFFNEDGSWRGRTRGREEGPEEVGEEEEGSKWRRTE